VRVRRDGKPLTFSLTAGPAQAPRKPADEPPDAPAAGDLLSTPQLEAAGIEASARVLAVNGEPARTRAALQRQLRPRRPPVLLYVQQDGERFFAVVR
jgi:hypothetical protein